MNLDDNCVEYFTCFEYRVPTKQLCIRTCTNKDLARIIKQKRLEEIVDKYTKKAVIQFIEDELLRRGKLSDASLLIAIVLDSIGNEVRAYHNNSSLLVAAETFSTASCL